MRHLAAVAAVVALGFCSTACGSNSDSASSASTAAPTSSSPATVDVEVVLTDSGSLDALYNENDSSCTSISYDEVLANALGGGDGDAPATGVTLTLHDAGGTIVGTTTLPSSGGTFDRSSGCSWPVTFSAVPASDFYEVDLAAYKFETSATGSAGAPIEVRF